MFFPPTPYGYEFDPIIVQPAQVLVIRKPAVKDQVLKVSTPGAVFAVEINELQHHRALILVHNVGIPVINYPAIGVLRQDGKHTGQRFPPFSRPVVLEMIAVAPVGYGGEVEVGGIPQ